MDVGQIDTIEPIPNDVLLINMMTFCFLFPNGLILKKQMQSSEKTEIWLFVPFYRKRLYCSLDANIRFQLFDL